MVQTKRKKGKEGKMSEMDKKGKMSKEGKKGTMSKNGKMGKTGKERKEVKKDENSTCMRLKVSWQTVKKRICVFMGNIFRLRAFWEICHPNTPMRFLSLDEHVVHWFDNGIVRDRTGAYAKNGGIRSVQEHTLEPYRATILTAVPSWGHTDPGMPPKVALLFKAMPGGRVITKLRQTSHHQPWMKVQVQEHGRYNSVNVVEALDWILPSAADSSESIVVLLDFYCAHLTDEVAAMVREKGHVLMFHGGGCTQFTLVNETHLHALLDQVLLHPRNAAPRCCCTRCCLTRNDWTPKMTMNGIISIVQAAWLSINHARVAEKGYKQTGPTMPLRGTVAPEAVFEDLWRVMEDLDESSSPTKVNMTQRDEAVAFVQEGFASGKWTTWADAPKLILEYDGEEDALIEIFGDYDTEDEETDELDGSDNEEEDGEAGAAGAAGSQPSAVSTCG